MSEANEVKPNTESTLTIEDSMPLVNTKRKRKSNMGVWILLVFCILATGSALTFKTWKKHRKEAAAQEELEKLEGASSDGKKQLVFDTPAASAGTTPSTNGLSGEVATGDTGLGDDAALPPLPSSLGGTEPAKKDTAADTHPDAKAGTAGVDGKDELPLCPANGSGASNGTCKPRDLDADGKPRLTLRERRLGSSLSPDLNNQDASGGAQAPAVGLSALQAANASNSSAASFNAGTNAAPAAGELEKGLRPVRLQSTKAELMGNRDMMLTQGTMIDCTLRTHILTTIAGTATCGVSRDVYSTSGKVKLIERGSQFTGFYQDGVKSGDTRIFFVWVRVETPTGVVAYLDSPNTDQLGASGMDGYIDNRFWDRFGGAIMLSVLQDGTAYATRNAPGAQNTTNLQQNTMQIADTALKASINIPPVLAKNQGEKVEIFVARDVDFSSVYELKKR